MIIYSFRLAKSPNIADDPTCLPMGPIAYAKNGVAIFNALDSSGRNAVELEIFDECKGHSNGQGKVFLDSRTIPSQTIDKHVPGPQVVGQLGGGGRMTTPVLGKYYFSPQGGSWGCGGGGGGRPPLFEKILLFPIGLDGQPPPTLPPPPFVSTML